MNACLCVHEGKSDCVSSGICSPMCAQHFCLCPCVYVFVRSSDCGRGQPERSSLMCVGGPGESRALEGVDVSALRDL